MEFCKHISPFIMKACSPLSQPCMFSHLTHHPMLCVCVVPATINTAPRVLWQAFGADKAGSTSIFAHLRTFEHFCAFILLSFSLFLHLSLLLSPFSIFFSYFLLSQSFSLTFSFFYLSLFMCPRLFHSQFNI